MTPWRKKCLVIGIVLLLASAALYWLAAWING